ncbi:replication protein A 70 kDa DNA-binding subunit D-like [Rutidosis leptorrhynchoides]|uniref:replication protein A 70 kDa DNA-binding subunit D-like n=1 Tax=Rutidosis leptorrhynchoides TaxID=125765 RepID=UPI003A9A2EE4
MSEVVPFTLLNMINKERSVWKVRVKVIDEWKKTWFGKPDSILSYEFILVDFEGNKIRAMIYKNLMPFFAHSFKEGAFVDLSNFEVKLHDDEYKLVHHEFKINLVKKSIVKRCQPFNILRDIYNFVEFKDMQEWIVSKDDVFDVVGLLVKVTKMKVDKETEVDKKSIEFELADASGERIRCKLWGGHAENLYKSLELTYKTDVDVILMLHNCRLKDWEGPQVNNQLWGFKLFINDSVQPIVDFKNALASARDIADYVKPVIEIDIGKNETSSLDKYTDQTKYPAYVLDDVRHIEDVCTFVVRGWIHSFNDNEGWFQYYCSMCEKNKVLKVYDVEEMKYVYDCRVCKWTGDDPIKK